ncbi:MAG TPA: N-acetylmuramoyl-L-alanine amidase [Myxococcales bacterium]|jgi:N-acetylmuramoyl-L-alanine amidase
MRTTLQILLGCGLLLSAGSAAAQKVFINPSNQTANSVCAGGVESTYAMDNGTIAAGILTNSGFEVQVSDDFNGANAAAASWGAQAFLSVHSNAGGGHGTETLKGWYVDSAAFANAAQAALLAKLPYQSRGVKDGSCGTGRCKVLNYSGQTAALVEVVFHDCCTSSGYTGHPPSEGDYLVDPAKRQIIGSALAQGVCDYFGKTCNGNVQPANGNIMGVVYTNGDINQHVAPATLTLSTGATATYDGSALWRFDVPPGSYSVTASAAGYKTATRACPNPVTSGATSWCSVEVVADTPTTGTLKGVVYQNGDKANHVAPATVVVEGGPTATYDGAAEWSFTLAAGSYTVTVSAAGYQTRTLACPNAVAAGGTAQCDVELTAEPPPPDAGEPAGLDAAAQQEPPDAAAVEQADVGTGNADAGKADAGKADAGKPGARDGGIPPGAVGGGCGCSSGSGGAFGALAMPLALWMMRARRRRSSGISE